MDINVKKLIDLKEMIINKYPRFAAELAATKLTFNSNLEYKTAATDGKNIYFDPEYLQSLTDDEKVFIVAHELMHIKFAHMARMYDKNGKMRNMTVWNIATDAIINANLEKDGFTIKEGYINMPEALDYTAEDFYEHLLKQMQNQNQNQEQGDHEQGQGQGQGACGKLEYDQNSADDHSMWEQFNKGNEQEGEQKKGTDKEQKQNKQNKPVSEKSEFDKNREERKQKAREFVKNQQTALQGGLSEQSESYTNRIDSIGESEPLVDWRALLRREFEKTQTIWSQRRAIEENNYAYRLEEYDLDDGVETEVMLDVSGSVSSTMLKSFLRQLKPLIKEGKLKVGFFADEASEKFVEIKTALDIDNLYIEHPGWGTNMDKAVKAFSKRKDVNKIVFTDGCPGKMPDESTKDINVIWLVYENRDFHPCCGRVIDIYPDQEKYIFGITNNGTKKQTNQLATDKEF